MSIRLAVIGTTILEHDGDVERVEKRIARAIVKLSPDVVISGGARGVDSIAESVANRYGYAESLETLVIYRPRVKKFHGPGGYRERNEQIARGCTSLLRIACCAATTYGSGWTADEAERLGAVVVRWSPCAG